MILTFFMVVQTELRQSVGHSGLLFSNCEEWTQLFMAVSCETFNGIYGYENMRAKNKNCPSC